jgi:hypothetical protein
MLDFTQTNPKMTAAWRDHIAHGDIVSFRFPLAEEGAEDRPKARPCLVLDIQQIGDRRYALLAYGTSSRRPSNVGYEVHARKRAEYLSAGLNEPTKFVGRRRVLVPLTHRGFVICTAISTPVLGSLDGAPLKRLNAVRGRIHAERDIAAERRRDRRSLTTSPPHSAMDGTNDIVEQHSPKQRTTGPEVQG